MAHERARQIAELYSKVVRFSPVLGLFGHRQVGKTTYAAAVAARYWTLDDQSTRKRVASDAKSFIAAQRRYPTVIDECQMEPELFPALKERVRVNKRPGQFILTGSVRFTSRKAIRESLAGRMTSLELLPLTVSELLRAELSDSIPQLLAADAFTDASVSALPAPHQAAPAQKALEKYLLQGGLPGLCFIRQERLRAEALASLHQLILDRDLRMVVETRLSMETLMRYLRWIASNGWNPYNASECKRRLGLAAATQKGLLFALESIFLIRRIPLNARSGEIVLLEDQYEEWSLSDGRHGRADQLLSAFYRCARAQFQYQLGPHARYESYWTRSGARIPLVIRTDAGLLGFAVVAEDQPTLSQRRSAESFLRREPRGKVVFLADRSMKARILDSRILFCSLAAAI